MHSKNNHWRTLQTTHSNHHYQRATVRGQECNRNIYIINRLRTGLAVERPSWRSYWARPLVGEGWLLHCHLRICGGGDARPKSSTSNRLLVRQPAKRTFECIEPAVSQTASRNQAQQPFYSGRCFGERSSAVNQAKIQGEKPNPHYRPFEVACLHPPNCCHPRPT